VRFDFKPRSKVAVQSKGPTALQIWTCSYWSQCAWCSYS